MHATPGARTGTVRLRAILIASLALVTAGCSAGPAAPAATPAGSPAAQLPALSNVALDRENVAQATIGPAGGALDATGSNGATYHLEIPENAMLEPAVITIAPIESLKGLPEKAAVAAGVHLLPDGQHFAVPATLTITLPAAPAGGVLGFAYRGDMAEPGLYPTVSRGNTLTLTLFHFSGYAALMSTVQAADAAASIGLMLAAPMGQDPTTDQALGAIAAAFLQFETDQFAAQVSVEATLVTWLANGIQPAVQRLLAVTTFDIGGPFVEETIAVQEGLLAFDYVMSLLVLSSLPPVNLDIAATTKRELARSAANHAIDIANARCTVPVEGLLRAAWSINWQAWAEAMHVDDGTLAFDAVAGRLCLKAVFSPSDGAVFPEAIQPGGLGDLRLHLGYTVVDGTNPAAPVEAAPLYDLPFEIAVTPTGTRPAEVVHATTDFGGRFVHEFEWMADEPALQLRVDACFAHTIVTLMLRFICATTTIDRGEETTSGGATAESNAGTYGEVGCQYWIPANQCTEWNTDRPEGLQFWLEPKSAAEPGTMSMSATQQFKVDEVRLANGAMTSVTISGTFTVEIVDGGFARAWGAYDVALEDLGPILKWHGNVSGRVTGNPASDSTFAFSNSQMNVDISCGEDQIEYQFVKSAGGSFPSEASGSDSPGALVDVADGNCDVSVDAGVSASSSRAPSPGHNATATITFSVTIEVGGTSTGNPLD